MRAPAGATPAQGGPAPHSPPAPVPPVWPPMPALHGLDAWRRWIGHVTDAAGWGPRRLPSQRLTTGTPALVQRYAPLRQDGPAALLVPAPIKSAAIWDLDPPVSVVRRLVASGFRVYLLAWPRVGSSQGGLGLPDYAESMLLGAMEAVRRDCGEERVFVCGHSVGGILATLFSAAHPGRVRGLVLLGAPLHFGGDVGALGRLVSLFPDTRALAGEAATVPGSLLNLVSLAASPRSFLLERSADWLASLGDPGRMRRHLLVERWTLDESALPRQLFLDLVDRLYRDDAFLGGRLRLGGARLVPRDVRAPVACVISRRCDIAPPESVLPVLERLGTGDRELIWYAGDTGVSLQHVGMLVGATAHRNIWPRLVEWMRAR